MFILEFSISPLHLRSQNYLQTKCTHLDKMWIYFNENDTLLLTEFVRTGMSSVGQTKEKMKCKVLNWTAFRGFARCEWVWELSFKRYIQNYIFSWHICSIYIKITSLTTCETLQIHTVKRFRIKAFYDCMKYNSLIHSQYRFLNTSKQNPPQNKRLNRINWVGKKEICWIFNLIPNFILVPVQTQSTNLYPQMINIMHSLFFDQITERFPLPHQKKDWKTMKEYYCFSCLPGYEVRTTWAIHIISSVSIHTVSRSCLFSSCQEEQSSSYRSLVFS